MPNIRQVNSQVDGLNPSDRGSTALAISGGRVASNYEQLGSDVGGAIKKAGAQYVEHVTRQEQLTALNLSAQAQSQAAEQWNTQVAQDAASPLHDPHLADKFNEGIGKTLDNIGNSFTTEEGQQWWQEHRVSVEQHFRETTAADMSTLEGAQAVRNNIQIGKTAENLAYMDPSHADAARGTLESARQLAMAQLAATGHADPRALVQLNQLYDQQLQAVTVAQGRGVIDAAVNGGQDPEAAYKAFAATPAATTRLDDGNRNSLQNYAEAAARAKEVKDRTAENLARRAEDDAADQAISGMQAKVTPRADGTYQVDPTVYDDIRRVALMPGAQRNPEKLRTLESWLEHAGTQVPVKTNDASTYGDFAQRALLPDGDPHRLTQDEVFAAEATGRLTSQSASMFREQIKPGPKDPAVVSMDKTFENFLKGYENRITHTDEGSPVDPAGGARLYEFRSDMRAKIDAAIAAGVKPADIERTLLNPNDPSYLGQFATVFAGDNQEAMRDHVEALLKRAGDPHAPQAPADRAWLNTDLGRWWVTRELGPDAVNRIPALPRGSSNGAPAADAAPVSRAAPMPGVATRRQGESPEAYLARTAHGGGQPAPARATHAAAPAAPAPGSLTGAVGTGSGRVPIGGAVSEAYRRAQTPR